MDKCPKCGQLHFLEGGKFLKFSCVGFKTRVKVFFFWVNLNLTADMSYCPGCGFSAVQNIGVK